MMKDAVTAADLERAAEKDLRRFLEDKNTRLTINLENDPDALRKVGAYAVAYCRLNAIGGKGVDIEMLFPEGRQEIVFERTRE